MWMNLFTIALAIAFACGTAALIVQYREFEPAETKRRRVPQRRLGRARG